MLNWIAPVAPVILGTQHGWTGCLPSTSASSAFGGSKGNTGCQRTCALAAGASENHLQREPSRASVRCEPHSPLSIENTAAAVESASREEPNVQAGDAACLGFLARARAWAMLWCRLRGRRVRYTQRDRQRPALALPEGNRPAASDAGVSTDGDGMCLSLCP